MTSEPQVNCYSLGRPMRGVTAWCPPETLREVADEGGELVAELIQSYTSDVGERLQRIRRAMSGGDVIAILQEIHTIKGSSKQMAAHQVAWVCELIEAGGREPQMAQLAELLSQLEVGVTEVCRAMEWYRQDHAGTRG